MYCVRILDATDAYYYADIMGKVVSEKLFLELKDAKKYADQSFDTFNKDWKSLSEMNDADGGYDARVYNEHEVCVYKSHERFSKKPMKPFSIHREEWMKNRAKSDRIKYIFLFLLIGLSPLLVNLFKLIEGGGITKLGVYYAQCSVEVGETIIGQKCIEDGQEIYQPLQNWLISNLQLLMIFWSAILVLISSVLLIRFLWNVFISKVKDSKAS